ncbi:MAG: hypothetical protein M3245_04470 [Actinomycetota bacterium]|nr:hypothetical protein [Actinomycetota bacterium]
MKRFARLAPFVAVAVVAAVSTSAGATTPVAVQENVRFVANVPGSTGGHAAVEGNRLYVGAYGIGMTIFDISNLERPVKVGEYKPGPKDANDPGARADAVPDAAIWDGRHIATLSGTSRANATRRTEFLDVTNPAAPRLLWTLGPGEVGEAHNGDIVDARKLFLPSGSNASNRQFRIYDVEPVLADPPREPALVFGGNMVNMWRDSEFRDGRPLGGAFTHIHDIEVYVDHSVLMPESEWTDQDGDGTADPTYEPRDIALVAEGGNYLGAGNTGSVFIIDITDPTAPVVRNRWLNTSGHPIRYHHEAQLLDGDRSIMFVSDEDLHNGCQAGGLAFLRLSEDLTQATKLSEWFNGTGTPAPNCSAHVFSSHGNHVFMGSYNAGLQVIDASDPARPTRAGQYIAEGANSWGALYHKGYVYVGDFGPRGLDVFEFIDKPVAKALVKAPNPGTRTTGGIAERGCRAGDPYGPTNGTDGLIVPIPEYARDGKHVLRATGSSAGPYDLDIWFHGDSCASMGYPGGNDSRDAVEPIPEGATMASVDLYVGTSMWVYAQVLPPTG